jgi:hypothetical protein
MTRREDDNLGVLAPLRLLITFIVAGVASASSVGLVAIIDTWWIVAFAVLFLLAATGVIVAVIVRELDRTSDPSRGSSSDGNRDAPGFVSCMFASIGDAHFSPGAWNLPELALSQLAGALDSPGGRAL